VTTTTGPRRTQAERTATMRARIIAATIDSIVELGHAATTTVEVQRRAGVSRGALLHHFPSRAELLVAAIDDLFGAQRQLSDDFRSVSLGIDAGIDALWHSFTGPLEIAATELWSAARNDAELREILTRYDRGLGRDVRQMCSRLWPDYVDHPNYDLALLIVIDAMHGAAQARVVRSDRAIAARLTGWKRMMHLLLD
jgi:AcrR family transcriptional regulator